MRSSLRVDTMAVEHLGFGVDAVEYQAGWAISSPSRVRCK